MHTADMIGKKFGHLTVITDAYRDTDGNMRVVCKCDCGRIKIIRAYHLNMGQVIFVWMSTGQKTKKRRTANERYRMTVDENAPKPNE